MRSVLRKFVIFIVAVSVMMSPLIQGGSAAVYAAVISGPEKVQSLKSTDIQTTTITLKWKKVTNADGYEVIRNNKTIKRLKKISYKDKGLKSGKIYTYTIRAYKTYREKQYYNSKTKRWTASMPQNKYWKGRKTRLVVRRKYGPKSKTLKLITKVNDPYAQKIPILTFHRIVSDEVKETYFKDDQWVAAVSDFEEQMRYLYENNYRIIDLQEFEAWYDGRIKLPKKTAVLTIDDGDYELYYQIYPVLKKYGFKATSFIIGSYVNDETAAYEENEKHHIGADLINIIRTEYPQIQFQSHTYDLHRKGEDGQYPVYTKTYEELEEDFRQNEDFGFEYVAYPFGQYTDDMKKAAENSGMRMGFTFGKYVCATKRNDRFEIPRIKINGQITIGDFIKRLKKYLK